MEIAYYDIGGVEASCSQFDEVVQSLYQACINNTSCEVIELRSGKEPNSQTIIVDVADGSFDAHNSFGIQRVERLALTYCSSNEFCWEVRALRKNFPVTIHQNHVLGEQPRSLCLYIEPWNSVERSWTPELFLRRVLWWLRTTADGTIHGDEQPIEQLFFSSPYNVLLPENYFDDGEGKQKNITFSFIEYEGINTKTLIGSYTDKNAGGMPFCVPITIVLEPVENGPIEEYPHTLELLQNILEKRGKGIVEPLKKSILDLVTEEGIEFQQDKKEFVLLLLGIPRMRNGVVEKIDTQGFVVESEIDALGESLSVLLKAPDQDRWYRDTLSNTTNDSWKSISLFPVNVKCYPSRDEIRKYSGLKTEDNEPVGIIAGVGALGGLLATIWNRECWGEWYYVDSDIIQAHNIVRHISSHHGIGHPKSIVVDSIVNDIHLSSEEKVPQSFVASIVSDEAKLNSVIENADIVVDATTTLDVPRVISRKDNFPRTVSVFITPSGMASVMLLEDNDRKVRCNSLEAQYYRAILQSDWGREHLSGHIGRHWVGAGCRELSLVMSDELVHLHAATLSRQIRKASCHPEARIRVWDYQDDLGGITPHEIPVFTSSSARLQNWEIIWDDGFLSDARNLRTKELPNETGGILFGIIDQKDKTITLVKACSAPQNSTSTTSSFTRGAYESNAVLDECHDRTAGVVSYVGEWHSHPPNCGALPSQDDIGQLNFLTYSLQTEGMPALMMIVSDSSVGFYLDDLGIILETN